MRLIKHKTSINFLGPERRKLALWLSAVIIIASVASLARNGLELGIDFTGGILLEVGYEQAADLETIRSNLANAGFSDAQVQLFGTETDVLVRLPPHDGDANSIRVELQSTLAASGDAVELRRVEFVSPQVGKELTEQGGLAMIFALLMIFAYVMFRFQWKFAAGAVAALAHINNARQLASQFTRLMFIEISPWFSNQISDHPKYMLFHIKNS